MRPCPSIAGSIKQEKDDSRNLKNGKMEKWKNLFQSL
jgi:hypothetical protein